MKTDELPKVKILELSIICIQDDVLQQSFYFLDKLR